MTLNIIRLIFINVGLLVICYLLFFIGSLILADPLSNHENYTLELIIYSISAIIHITLNWFLALNKIELPLKVKRIITGGVACIYVIIGIMLIKEHILVV
jgi:hypothetical protein